MFKLLFSYLNSLKRPYLQSKLNIWEYREVGRVAKISHILEFLISSSLTFQTKFIKTQPYGASDILSLGVILYYSTLIIYWLI